MTVHFKDPATGEFFGFDDDASITAARAKGWQEVTIAEIEAENRRREAEAFAALPYTEKRAMEYPPIGDQLDALWKTLNQLRMNGADLPGDADAVLGQVLAVKKKYPKK